MNITIGILVLLLIFCIPVLIGIYVYRDASRRGMNAVLWTLIAVFTPSLLGLIIYLLVRNNYSDLTCPNCNAPVEESFVVCPSCRTKLRPTCPACSAPVQTTWQVCPHCGEPLPQYDGSVATPVRAKDTTLKKILITLIIIPVILIVLMAVAAFLFSVNNISSGSQSVHFTTTTVEKYLEETTDERQQRLIQEWLSDTSVSESNAASIHPTCMVMPFNDAPGEFTYVVYIPGIDWALEKSLYPVEQGGLFSDSYCLEMRLYSMGVPSTEPLLIIATYQTSDTDYPPETLDVYYNGNLCNIQWYYQIMHQKENIEKIPAETMN